MIKIANRTFNNSGEVAEHALQVALVLKQERGGMEFASERTFMGFLATSAGYISAVFAHYGGYEQVTIPAEYMSMGLIDVAATETRKRFDREREARCNEITAELRQYRNDADALRSQLAAVMDAIADREAEHADLHYCY